MASANKLRLAAPTQPRELFYVDVVKAVVRLQRVRKARHSLKTPQTAEVCAEDELVTLKYLRGQSAVLTALAMAYCSWYGYPDGVKAAFEKIRQLLVSYIAEVQQRRETAASRGPSCYSRPPGSDKKGGCRSKQRGLDERLRGLRKEPPWCEAPGGFVTFDTLQEYLDKYSALACEPTEQNKAHRGEAKLQLVVMEQLMSEADNIPQYIKLVRLESFLLELLQQKDGQQLGRVRYQQLLSQLVDHHGDPASRIQQLEQWLKHFTPRTTARAAAAAAAAGPSLKAGAVNAEVSSAAYLAAPGKQGPDIQAARQDLLHQKQATAAAAAASHICHHNAQQQQQILKQPLLLLLMQRPLLQQNQVLLQLMQQVQTQQHKRKDVPLDVMPSDTRRTCSKPSESATGDIMRARLLNMRGAARTAGVCVAAEPPHMSLLASPNNNSSAAANGALPNHLALSTPHTFTWGQQQQQQQWVARGLRSSAAQLGMQVAAADHLPGLHTTHCQQRRQHTQSMDDHMTANTQAPLKAPPAAGIDSEQANGTALDGQLLCEIKKQWISECAPDDLDEIMPQSCLDEAHEYESEMASFWATPTQLITLAGHTDPTHLLQQKLDALDEGAYRKCTLVARISLQHPGSLQRAEQLKQEVSSIIQAASAANTVGSCQIGASTIIVNPAVKLTAVVLPNAHGRPEIQALSHYVVTTTAAAQGTDITAQGCNLSGHHPLLLFNGSVSRLPVIDAVAGTAAGRAFPLQQPGANPAAASASPCVQPLPSDSSAAVQPDPAAAVETLHLQIPAGTVQQEGIFMLSVSTSHFVASNGQLGLVLDMEPALASDLSQMCSDNPQILRQISLALLAPDGKLLQLLPKAASSAPAAVQTALAGKFRAVQGFQLLVQFIQQNKPELLSWLLNRLSTNPSAHMSLVCEQCLALTGSNNLQRPLIELAAITGNIACTQVILDWMCKHPRLVAAAGQHQHAQDSSGHSNMSTGEDDVSSKAQPQLSDLAMPPTVEHCSIHAIAAAHPDGWQVLEAQINDLPLVMGPEDDIERAVLVGDVGLLQDLLESTERRWPAHQLDLALVYAAMLRKHDAAVLLCKHGAHTLSFDMAALRWAELGDTYCHEWSDISPAAGLADLKPLLESAIGDLQCLAGDCKQRQLASDYPELDEQPWVAGCNSMHRAAALTYKSWSAAAHSAALTAFCLGIDLRHAPLWPRRDGWCPESVSEVVAQLPADKRTLGGLIAAVTEQCSWLSLPLVTGASPARLGVVGMQGGPEGQQATVSPELTGHAAEPAVLGVATAVMAMAAQRVVPGPPHAAAVPQEQLATPAVEQTLEPAPPGQAAALSPGQLHATAPAHVIAVVTHAGAAAALAQPAQPAVALAQPATAPLAAATDVRDAAGQSSDNYGLSFQHLRKQQQPQSLFQRIAVRQQQKWQRQHEEELHMSLQMERKQGYQQQLQQQYHIAAAAAAAAGKTPALVARGAGGSQVSMTLPLPSPAHYTDVVSPYNLRSWPPSSLDSQALYDMHYSKAWQAAQHGPESQQTPRSTLRQPQLVPCFSVPLVLPGACPAAAAIAAANMSQEPQLQEGVLCNQQDFQLQPHQPSAAHAILPSLSSTHTPSATQSAVAEAHPPAGYPVAGVMEAPPRLMALLQQQLAGKHVEPADLAASAGSGYVPAPAGAATTAAAAPSAVEIQNPPTAAAGEQGSSTVKWTLQHYREVHEQNRLRRQQQHNRGLGPNGDTGTLPAPAPAAAATRKAKKRKKNNRPNMRHACRQAEQASADADAAGAGAEESSDDQRASAGKAGRKGGANRPSLVHRRIALIRKLKALLGWRGWLLWNTLVAVVGDRAGNLNDAGVDALLHALFGRPGYRWPQEAELMPQGIEDDLYLARLLSSLTGSFIHPSEVAGFFKQKRKGKTEVNQDYLASKGLHPDEWTWPLPEGPLAQPGAQQTPDLQFQSTEDIYAVEDAAVAALQEYNAEAAALLAAGLQRLRDGEDESNGVLKPTGIKRRHALEKNIIDAARQRDDPAATAAATAAAAVAEQAAMGADAAPQQLPATAAPIPPRTAHRRRARQGGVNQGSAEAATDTAAVASAAAVARAAKDAQLRQTDVNASTTALQQGASGEFEETGTLALAGQRHFKRREITFRRYQD